MVLDTNKGVRVFNFDNEDKIKPLATLKVWSNRWKQMNDQDEFVSIDLGKLDQRTDPLTLTLAAKIEAFYECDSGRSLADSALLVTKMFSLFPSSNKTPNTIFIVAFMCVYEAGIVEYMFFHFCFSCLIRVRNSSSRSLIQFCMSDILPELFSNSFASLSISSFMQSPN